MSLKVLTKSDEFFLNEGDLPDIKYPDQEPFAVGVLDHLEVHEHLPTGGHDPSRWKLLGTVYIPTRSETIEETDERGYALGKKITTHYVRMIWTWELVS